MENFNELMKRRRSMRKFTDEKISPAQMDYLLRTALMSPSGKSIRGWQFVVVQEGEMLSKLARAKAQGAELLAGAAAAIVVLSDERLSDVWIEDASVATTSLLYAAEDLGLGACWVQIRCRKTAEGGCAEAEVRSLLNVADEHLRVLSIVALGHKGMERKPQDESRLHWDKVTYFNKA